MRKTVLALAAGAVFAYAGANHEITAVVGGVHPFTDSELKNHLTYGLRIGLALDAGIFDQIEGGYDYSHDVDYKKASYSSYDAYINRIYLNILKELPIGSKTRLYALAGIGYEDITNNNLPGEDDYAFGQYGAGIKQYLNDYVALRGEVRHAIRFDSGHKDYLFYSLGVVVKFGPKDEPVVVPEPVVVAAPAPEPVPEPIVEPTPEPVVVAPVETINEKEIQGTVVKTIVLTNKSLGFEFNSAVVDIAGDAILENVAADIKANQDVNIKVLIAGHTDSIGSDAYNFALSQRRAQSVKDKLLAKGVPNDRLFTKGYGEERPIATNQTAEGRAANRRVEIIFVNTNTSVNN
jgi:OOP family OmpA-OmpF porin